MTTRDLPRLVHAERHGDSVRLHLLTSDGQPLQHDTAPGTPWTLEGRISPEQTLTLLDSSALAVLVTPEVWRAVRPVLSSTNGPTQ